VRRKVFGIPVGWRFVVGSHRAIKGDGSAGFYGEDLWSDYAARMGLAARTRDHRGCIFYAELYGCTYSGQRIQDLTYGKGIKTPGGFIDNSPGMVVFDVLRKGKWMHPGERLDLLDRLDFDPPPTLYWAGYAEGIPAAHAEGVSMIDRKTQREGCVVESITGPRRKAKFVGAGYLMRKEAA
jgi:hypothetical protein